MKSTSHFPRRVDVFSTWTTVFTAIALMSAPVQASQAVPDAPEATVDGPADTAEEYGEESAAEELSDTDRANQLSAEGVAAYERGDFQGAIDLLMQAYELSPQPNLVFNIGRVYEELGELEEAQKFYTEFLTLPGVELETRAFAAERVEVIRRVLAQAKAKADAEADPGAPPPQPQVSPTVDGSQQPMEPAPKGIPKLRIAGAATLATGGLALIAAGVLGGVGANRAKKAGDEQLVADQNEMLRDARTLAGAADGLFIAGGIVAAAGITMLGVSYAKKFNKQRASVVPSVGSRQVSLGLVGRF